VIPQIDNRTDILILQHVGERFHPFNTARIVRKALHRCHLITNHNREFASQPLPIHANAGLLYPSSNAPTLPELPVADRPEQLIIVDGTWHQAKTIVRDVPQLGKLPCYRLAPASPGQYRIRREPDAQSLSTLEATIAALQTLEPDLLGLEQLMSAFLQMIDQQLEYRAHHSEWRSKRTKNSLPRHLPRGLLQNSSDLVVAYGEATPGGKGFHHRNAIPVNWVAERLGTAERFSCSLRQDNPLSPSALQHMRLPSKELTPTLSSKEFRERWKEFVQPNDLLIVYHPRTYQLLRHLNAAQPRCLALKSTFGTWKSSARSLEALVATEEIKLPPCAHKSRATQRLEMAIALVDHLRADRAHERTHTT